MTGVTQFLHVGISGPAFIEMLFLQFGPYFWHKVQLFIHPYDFHVTASPSEIFRSSESHILHKQGTMSTASNAILCVLKVILYFTNVLLFVSVLGYGLSVIVIWCEHCKSNLTHLNAHPLSHLKLKKMFQMTLHGAWRWSYSTDKLDGPNYETICSSD